MMSMLLMKSFKMRMNICKSPKLRLSKVRWLAQHANQSTVSHGIFLPKRNLRSTLFTELDMALGYRRMKTHILSREILIKSSMVTHLVLSLASILRESMAHELKT